MMVGAPVSGKKVLILDDVMTAGTATRNAVDMIRSGGGEVVGIVLCLDREEVGKEGGSTVKEMEKYVGGRRQGKGDSQDARPHGVVRRAGEDGGSCSHERLLGQVRGQR
jgi:hypothetical protein